MMNDITICNKCKFFYKNNSAYPTCKSKPLTKTNFVTGKIIVSEILCEHKNFGSCDEFIKK